MEILKNGGVEAAARAVVVVFKPDKSCFDLIDSDIADVHFSYKPAPVQIGFEVNRRIAAPDMDIVHIYIFYAGRHLAAYAKAVAPG